MTTPASLEAQGDACTNDCRASPTPPPTPRWFLFMSALNRIGTRSWFVFFRYLRYLWMLESLGVSTERRMISESTQSAMTLPWSVSHQHTALRHTWESHGRAQDHHTNGPNRVAHPVELRHLSSPVDRGIFFSIPIPPGQIIPLPCVIAPIGNLGRLLHFTLGADAVYRPSESPPPHGRIFGTLGSILYLVLR